MNPKDALQFVTENLTEMLGGEIRTFEAPVFEAAFEVQSADAARSLGFLKPAILAETGFRMKFPQWTCVKTPTTYIVTKPRRNPYAAQHGNP